jgi:hypothetical protein
MWSSPVELYPVHLSSTLSPLGQGMIIEPQVAIREVTERYSVVNLTGVAAYENRNAISTLHWVARC